MQAEERFEFAHEGQTGYIVITREVRPDTGDGIGILMVNAPPGTLALKKKNPDVRVAAQVAWQRIWRPAVIQQAAENILAAVKEKDGAEPHSVDFVGRANNGKLVVQRKANGISFTEQFDAGLGIAFELSVKTMKKLANLILNIEVPIAEAAAQD